MGLAWLAGVLTVANGGGAVAPASVVPALLGHWSFEDAPAATVLREASGRTGLDVRLGLIVWVDAMCPYKGDEQVRAEADPIFQGVDWLAVRPKIATAPRVARPGPVD